MAKATLIQEEPVVPPPSGVVLELSMEEAETVRRVAHYVGGHTLDSRRRHISSIDQALYAAGVGMGPDDLHRDSHGHVPSLYFK